MNDYAKKLIENLPPMKKQNLDLVLDGGAFNGSYLVGSLYLLEEMERKNMIAIKRISGCSIGSFAALLYFSRRLNEINIFNDFAFKDLRENCNLEKSLAKLKEFGSSLDSNFYKKVNGKLFIKFYNIKTTREIVRCKYQSNEDLMECIVKSCFVPFCINGSLTYEKKYVDGIFPYVFACTEKRKVLHLNLLGSDKVANILKIKNEQNNYTRMLTGLLDVQNFFITGTSTSMCSYVNNWSLFDHGLYYWRRVVEKVIIYVLFCLSQWSTKNNIALHVLSNIVKEIYKVSLKTYFL
jgi:hypothetical protein